MREVWLIAPVAAVGTYFMVSPSALQDLLAWIAPGLARSSLAPNAAPISTTSTSYRSTR
jgi:hypothetical protein